jgi:hypothetical protein
MIPAIPQPDPVPLPAPGWLLWGLLILTFFLHLVPMNLVLGGSLLGAIARVRARRGDRPHDAELAHIVVKSLPVLISMAVTMGVAALLFLQVLYGRVFFVSSVLMAWWWLGVILLLALAYYAAYLMAYREREIGPAATFIAWLIAAVIGLIALIYGNNMTMMLKPQDLPAMYAASGRGALLNLADASLIPRHLHMFLGAIAVSGLAVAVLGSRRLGGDPDFGRWAIRYGAFVCGAATALNVFAGLWWLAALPRDVIMRFMGQDMAAVIVLLAGIFLTFSGAGLLVFAAAAPADRSPKRFVFGAVHCLPIGIVLMILTRDTVRRASLDLAQFQPVTWVAPQWGPIVIFAVLLVAALATVVWMVRALAVGRGAEGAK